MKLHANARLSPNGRRLLIDRLEIDGWDIGDAAEAAGISVRTARKWLARWRAEGELGLVDRSSAPKTVANKTDEARVACIAALRRLRMTGPEIAEVLQMALSTVSGILKSIDMGKLGRLGLEPARRYERARPGELIHVDVKNWGGSSAPGTGSPGSQASARPAITATKAAPAGSSVTSPSTTRPAWPMSRSWPTRRPSPRPASCAAPKRSSRATA
jgi:transposase